MLMENFKLDHVVVNDKEHEAIHCIMMTSDVVIERDGKTYSIPLVQRYNYPTKDYNVQTLEESILGYMLHAKKISEKWVLVKTDEIKLEGGGRILTQRPFDIINDLS